MLVTKIELADGMINVFAEVLPDSMEVMETNPNLPTVAA